MDSQQLELLELPEEEQLCHEQLRLLPDCWAQLCSDPCSSSKELRVEALREELPEPVWWPEELEDLHSGPERSVELPLEELHPARRGS